MMKMLKAVAKCYQVENVIHKGVIVHVINTYLHLLRDDFDSKDLYLKKKQK